MKHTGLFSKLQMLLSIFTTLPFLKTRKGGEQGKAPVPSFENFMMPGKAQVKLLIHCVNEGGEKTPKLIQMLGFQFVLFKYKGRSWYGQKHLSFVVEFHRFPKGAVPSSSWCNSLFWAANAVSGIPTLPGYVRCSRACCRLNEGFCQDEASV